MKLSDNYNASDKYDIIRYAEQLHGKTFEQVLQESLRYEDGFTSQEEVDSLKNQKRKGGLPNLIEKYYFGYNLNSDSSADFKDAGLELKVTPYEIKKAFAQLERANIPIHAYRAGERLVLTTINFTQPIQEQLPPQNIPAFRHLVCSHVWDKCKNMLLIYYYRDANLKAQKRNLEYPIHFIYFMDLTDPSFKEDFDIMCDDYDFIRSKILTGHAHELTEGSTLYLSTCTKGKDSSETQIQYYPLLPPPFYVGSQTHIPVKKRAFCLKSSYMTYLLQKRIIPYNKEREAVERIPVSKDNVPFEEKIKSLIKPYIGRTDQELCEMLHVSDKQSKSKWVSLVYAMLGIKSNQAEQFLKADIVVKVLSVNENYVLDQHVSFSSFKFQTILNETWDNAWLNQYFSTKKFFIVIFQKRKDSPYRTLWGSFFWNMPEADIEGPLKEGWERTRQTISNGVHLYWNPSRNRMENNLPKSSDNSVMHIRPHTQKSLYIFPDGTYYGNGKLSDTDVLPNGTRMTIQSYWLNKKYMTGVVQTHLSFT